MTTLKTFVASGFALSLVCAPLNYALATTGNVEQIATLPPGTVESVAETVRASVEQGNSPLIVAGQTLNRAHLAEFYTTRDFQPAWIVDGGFSPQARILMTVLAEAEAEGLSPSAYHGDALADGGAKLGASETELLLTDALMAYVGDIAGGQVALKSVDKDWRIAPPPADRRALAEMVANAQDPLDMLRSFAPAHPAYIRLRAALAELIDVSAAGDWPQIPDGDPLRPGMSDARVPELRMRLMIGGDMDIGDGDASSELFDPALATALRGFQTRHGLTADGVLGARTLAELNVPAAKRARRVALNLERWRALPRVFGATRIEVNTAASTLTLWKDGRPDMNMNVVVGSPRSPTPVLSDRISTITLNPTWTVPSAIAGRELLPKLKKDPAYLMANNMRIRGGKIVEDSPEAMGLGMDWSQFNNRLPFQIVQLSGTWNALGRLKFNMPNPDDIYLHDTPTTEHFSRLSRALSHGCVRLESPLALADELMDDHNGWTFERLESGIITGATQTLALAQPVPVYLLYWTAWVDDLGTLHFRDDVYGRDKRLLAALPHPLPTVPVIARNTE